MNDLHLFPLLLSDGGKNLVKNVTLVFETKLPFLQELSQFN